MSIKEVNGSGFTVAKAVFCRVLWACLAALETGADASGYHGHLTTKPLERDKEGWEPFLINRTSVEGLEMGSDPHFL